MTFAELNGVSLGYSVSGTGAPLIFVHGFLANGTGAYYAEAKRLLAASYRVHAMDMRSHGQSAAVSENVTLEQCARDIGAFADLFHLDGALLVGHSMGGFICMKAALLFPDKFSALALLNPAGSKGQPTSERQIADFMVSRTSPEAMYQRHSGMYVRKPSQKDLDVLREAALQLPDAIAEQWLRREWPTSDLTDGLASIQLPVLSVIGARDVVVPPQRQYDDAMKLANAKVVTFTDEGHMLPVENPERCVHEVLRFFQDLT